MSVIAITGASAGIGRATALAFARQGDCIGLIARSKKALMKVKNDVEQLGSEALVLPLDVAEPYALEHAANQIEEEFGPINIWINCAMVSVFSRFEDITPQEYQRITDVSYHGYVLGTLAAVKRMKQRNCGHIIQIGSALSYRAVPLQSAYCGAKYAIRGFTDSLRAELIHEKSAIELTMIQFPAFNTPQFSWSGLHMEKEPRPLPPIYDPTLAADVILWTAKNPQHEVWVGWPTWKAILGQKFFPRLLDHYMATQGWKGQLTNKRSETNRENNLFFPVETLHAVKGDFTELEIKEKPVLWLIKRQNFWINNAACTIVIFAFLLGFALG